MNQSWNASLYEHHHHYVSQMAVDLVRELSPQPGEMILDLGCGTGHLTAKIAESRAIVVGYDRAESMIEQARQNYPQLQFEVSDAEHLSWTNRFDGIFSNAALHWMTDAEAVVKGITNALKPGGRLIAEFGGNGNVKTIITGMEKILSLGGYSPPPTPWYFPSISEYSTLLERYGLEVRFAQLFDRPTPLEGEQGLRHWIVMFGSHLLSPVPGDRQNEILEQIETHLRPQLYQNNTWFADYRRLRIMAFDPH